MAKRSSKACKVVCLDVLFAWWKLYPVTQVVIRMLVALRNTRRVVACCTRSLATAATSSNSSASASAWASRSKFSQKLETGPTLDDFIAGDGPDSSNRVILGNTKASVFQT